MKPASGLEDILRPLGEILEEEAAADGGLDPDLAVDPLPIGSNSREMKQSSDNEMDQGAQTSSLNLNESVNEDSPQEPPRENFGHHHGFQKGPRSCTVREKIPNKDPQPTE